MMIQHLPHSDDPRPRLDPRELLAKLTPIHEAITKIIVQNNLYDDEVLELAAFMIVSVVRSYESELTPRVMEHLHERVDERVVAILSGTYAPEPQSPLN
jgi:hypothetical protein